MRRNLRLTTIIGRIGINKRLAVPANNARLSIHRQWEASMIPRTILWISLLIAGSFPALALSQQATVDSETSAPSDHQAHTSVSGDHDGTMGDHDEMMGDHDGAMGDHEGMHHDHGVDHNTPASLKCTHILEPGEWMIGYRYSNTYMGGNQTGTTLSAINRHSIFPVRLLPPAACIRWCPPA